MRPGQRIDGLGKAVQGLDGCTGVGVAQGLRLVAGLCKLLLACGCTGAGAVGLVFRLL